MKIETAILRNPWNWDEKTLEWARRETELTGLNHCPLGYDECLSGCCYPGRCIQVTLTPATDWFALAKAICVDPFSDDYWERERRYFEERDDRMFRNENDSEE